MMELAFRAADHVGGKLILDARCVRKLTRLEPAAISITRRFESERSEVERLIEEIYWREYGSAIAHHYPSIMSVHDVSGKALCAVGFRCAAEEPLFLEQYLGSPVEDVLAEELGAGIPRSNIVEIGNLASCARGASVFLFIALAAYLRERHYTHAVVTATDALRRTFDLFGFRPNELGAAKAQALIDGGASWGSYYSRNPKVLASAVSPCFRALERFLPSTRNSDLGRLFAKIHHSGSVMS